MNKGHTPTPWQVFDNPPEGLCVIREPDGPIKVVAEFPYADEEGQANAAFIVKAVNAHSELVVALDELLLALSLPGEHCELAQATTRAREALAKVSSP